jgi:hypothetical protein
MNSEAKIINNISLNLKEDDVSILCRLLDENFIKLQN